MERLNRENIDVLQANARFPILTRFGDNYMGRMKFCINYYAVYYKTAKQYLMSLFYGGGCPSGDAPFSTPVELKSMRHRLILGIADSKT